VTPEYPVVADTALLVPAINSPNFNLQNPAASPQPSWAILQNGLAYFFGLTIEGGTITGPDYIINTSGIFIYSGTPANGNLIGSWAGSAGTDAEGNTYPAGFNITQGAISGTTFSGTDFTINSTGAFFYNGTPAAGNLIFSISPAATTDAYGNKVLAGSVTYNGSNAVAFDPGTLAMTGYQNSSGQSGTWTDNTTLMLTNGVVINPGAIYLAGVSTGSISPPGPGDSILYGSTNGTPSGITHGEFIGEIPLSQVNTGVAASGNATAFTAVTNQYTLDSTLVPNSIYTLRVPFNGVWGLQVMTIGADINGTVTTLGTVGAAFATGAASGDSVNGYLEIEVYIVTAITCRISCKGIIHDNTVNVNNSTTATSPISTTVATGVAIAGGNTLGISIKFAASVAAQTITPEFEIFTRSGS
jgi:hypothetical protein